MDIFTTILKIAGKISKIIDLSLQKLLRSFWAVVLSLAISIIFSFLIFSQTSNHSIDELIDFISNDKIKTGMNFIIGMLFLFPAKISSDNTGIISLRQAMIFIIINSFILLAINAIIYYTETKILGIAFDAKAIISSNIIYAILTTIAYMALNKKHNRLNIIP